MSIKKKVVWLPYDMDTAIGINNSGLLTFSYNLEDTDLQQGGEFIFNGQDSVMWTNLRDAFGDDIKAMYQLLRSQDKISYDVVEQMFEEHQEKWSEAIFNEDAFFKYIEPLTNPEAGEQPDASYLPMAQGSKAEQRKWWLYNRFRYMDSKYNAGDALTDYIMMRAYSVDDITLTPYADIYLTTAWDGELTQVRAARGQSYVLPCPKDTANDAVVAIYSASQLASVGDLSGLKIKSGNFSMATRLQNLKIGDSSSSYSNTNLIDLQLGNNTLLQTLDVRNCPNLAIPVDISGCKNIENVYFDGTAITGLTLPNGGVLKVLHLSSTITNLTIMNQNAITDLTVASYANISTLRLENVPTVDTKTILNTVPVSTRIRLIGFSWEATNAAEITALLDRLDLMRGLDENGNNVEQAQVSGTIHTSSLTGAEIASFNERYPYLTVTADNVTSILYYKTWDGSSTVKAVTYINGVAQSSAPSVPSRTATAQYDYTGVGWSLEQDASVNDPNATTNITGDRTVYAAYSRTVRKYTATFVRASVDGGGTLYTQQNIPYGTTPVYGGATPTTTQGGTTDFMFNGWEPELAGITANTTYTAVFRDMRSPTRKVIDRTITFAEHSTLSVVGDYAFHQCQSLTMVDFPNVTIIGPYAFKSCKNLSAVSIPNVTSIGSSAFCDCHLRTINLPNLTQIESATFSGNFTLSSISIPNVTSIGASAFYGCGGITEVNFPNVTSIGSYAFAYCASLQTVSLPNAISIASNALGNCRELSTVRFSKLTHLSYNAFYQDFHLISAYFLASSVVVLPSANAFTNTPMSLSTYTGSFGSIYVPASLVSDYKAASNWSLYADRITAYGGN